VLPQHRSTCPSLLVIVAIALGTVGVVVKGFLYLLIIGVLILIADLIMAGVRFRRSGAG
jgi:hypothetical protein